MTRIYLDHAATTPLRPEAREAVSCALEISGNPSSLHGSGRVARQLIDRARDSIAEAMQCRSGDIIFTSGGTESANLAVFGAARVQPDRKHILVSAVEHHCVLHAAEALAADAFTIEVVPVNHHGFVAPREVAARIRPETALVNVMAANNEIGTLEPIEEIAAICRRFGTLFHTDAVQTAGHERLDTRAADLVSISAHKFGGPVGSGALIVRTARELRPMLFGGAQERGRRAGTENAPAIAGMAAALSASMASVDDERARIQTLRNRLRDRLLEVPGAWFNTPQTGALASILNVGFEDVRAETLLLALDLEGVEASSGSACASGSIEPSHVLLALGLSLVQASSCVRFSLGWSTTPGEIERAAEIIERIVARVRNRSAMAVAPA